ncbi:MAG: polysaccharide pyruvyl transferase family protein [Acidobacteriota bacterium]
MNPRTVLIAGYYGFGNTGDEAILASLLAGLSRRAPSGRAVVVSGDPPRTQAQHGVETIAWRDVAQIDRAVRASDLVIVGGGGLFQDLWGVDPETLLTPNHYGISFYAGPAVLAALAGKPLALLGLGIGPLASARAKRMVAGVCDAASFISVRDENSRDLLVASGVEAARVSVSADAAFGLAHDGSRLADALREAGIAPRPPIVGIALRPWALGVDPDRWEGEVAGALDRLAQTTDATLVFVPFQRSARADEDDASVAARVRARLSHPERAAIFPEPRAPAQTAGWLAQCDLVLAMRLHAAIFAISSGVPVVGVAYDPKVRALLEHAGIPSLVEPLRELTGWSLQARMESALEGAESLRGRLAAAAVQQKRLADSDLEAVAALLESRPAAPPATEALRELIADSVSASLNFSGELSRQTEALRLRRAESERLLAEGETAARAVEASRDHHRSEEARVAQQLATTRQQLHEVQSSRLWKAANLYWRARRAAARISRPARQALRRWSGRAPSDWVGPDVAHAAAAAAGPFGAENRHDVVLWRFPDAAGASEAWGPLVRRLAANGHRIFSVSPVFRSEGPAYEIGPSDRGVFSVSLRGDPFDAIDALRKDQSMGATISLVEDASWMLLAERLFRGRAWPLQTEAGAVEEVAAAFPKLSVVIVTYNNRDLNRLCLESVFARTEWPNLEVIVVDNGSTDGTRAFLEEEQRRLQPRLRVLLNADNRGFAAACNAGLAAASGEYLVLLNNDTVVTRGALTALIRHLSADPSLGLVGPVTNAISNAARVDVGYSGLEELPAWAREFTQAHDSEALEIPMLALFCVAMPRSVFERVGPLDERFGIGMFEDDDYSRRVAAAGLAIRCARDAFVHHWQMASFRKMPQQDYLSLFAENQQKYAAKWGEAPAARPQPAGDPVRVQLADLLQRVAASKGAVVFLPSIGWGISLVQRPHHLARVLARRGYAVVFDCSNADDRVEGFREVEPNLFLFRGSPELLHEIPAPLLWAFPYNYPAAESYPAGARTVYDWIDDLEVFPYDPAFLERNHARALRGATLVIAVARTLHEQALLVRPDALYVPNGVEDQRFLAPAPAPQDEALTRFLAGGGPVAGYYGALARWFDYPLLEETARLRPDWRFVLIGSELDGSLAREPLLKLPNLVWLGPKDYATLPGYLARFDVAMIPFRINAITLSTSPLKLFEYFAGGKPVVTTPMPECQAFPEVTIAGDARELAAALDVAREKGLDTGFRERLRAIAKENSWEKRADAVLSGLARLDGSARDSATAASSSSPGFCNICGLATEFLGGDPALDREALNCAHCLATSRYRSIARGLLEAFRRLAGVHARSLAELSGTVTGRRIAVYDTQTPFSTGASAYPIPDLLANCPWIDLQVSTYRPAEELGRSLGARTTNQNLERLTFPDASFDVVVTSDVMEHVRLAEAAHREIRRILRPAGVYLFTVPHFRHCATVTRVEIVDPADPSRDRHLMEPEYHGNANAEDGRALAYRAYGIDLDETLRGLGFSVEYTKQDFPENGIRNTELFFCRLGP